MASTYPEVELISTSNFAFSNSLHEQLRITGEAGNLVFSPFSLGLVLLMARFGARGKTAEQLDRVLHPTDSATRKLEDLRTERRGFFRVLKSIEDDRSGNYKVTMANRMFTGTGFNVTDEFKKISKATLGIKVKQLNFTVDGGRRAAVAINSWVANKTNGKIDGIISSDSLTNETQVVLVNTLHFKGPWEIPFDPAETHNTTFHLNSYKDTEVTMMTSEAVYAYGDLEGMKAQAVIIPYKGNRFSMHVYIPNSKYGYSLNSLLHALKATSMDQIRRNIRAPAHCEKVRLSLPKFSIQSELKLEQPLKQMGARDMFSADRANLIGISEDANVYLSHVVQKTFITVDEEGTEAAAASTIHAGPLCTPTITNITADRPFYFQIVDEKTGIVLFAGTVRDPSAALVEMDSLSTVRTRTENDDRVGETTGIPQGTAAPRSSSVTPASYVETTATAGTITAETLPLIVFATSDREIKTYSERTGDMANIARSGDRLTGLTWDSANRLVYYSGPSAIYSVYVDGSGFKRAATVSPQYGLITGLDFDWITSNLYVATDGGHVLTCKSTLHGSWSCLVIMNGQTGINGIALNPDQGKMYMTKYTRSKASILAADMDGGNPADVVPGLGYPSGIAIDQSSSRILWADYSASRIMSSDLRGGDVRKIEAQSNPRGIAVHDGQLYWGNPAAKKLLRGATSGAHIGSMDIGSSISHLTVAGGNVPNTSRPNHCVGQRCAGICVLTVTSFRCLV